MYVYVYVNVSLCVCYYTCIQGVPEGAGKGGPRPGHCLFTMMCITKHKLVIE